MARTDYLAIARGVRLARSGEGRRIRAASGVSQEAVAHRIGVTAAAVSLWETGNRLPRGEHAAAYYDVISSLARELLAGGAIQ